jgi:multiple sugar transport system substrate-binding protein
MLALFPEIQEFGEEYGVRVREAPVEGFGIERFVAEARQQESTWDMYVGMTAFVDMMQLIRGGVIEPWDAHVPEEMLDAIIPSVRQEALVDGETYILPFNIQVTIASQHAGLIADAGIDPDEIPVTWDDLIERARAVQDAGAAPFGCTFDAHGWRSLQPIAHSIDTDLYDEDGLFDFTHEAAVEALEIMRRMKELANPDVLDLGAADGGINDTPDERVWAAEQAAYYIKFSAGTVRFAEVWDDPGAFRLGPLPRTPDGVGGTGFWSGGAALFRYGENEEAAAEFMWDLVHDERILRRLIGRDDTYGGLPAYDTIWTGWDPAPEWLADWALPLRDQLEVARGIPPTILGLDQWLLPKPVWERYLTGEETDPRTVMAACRDMVRDELAEREA